MAKKTLDEIVEELAEFRDERSWEPFNNSKDMALSITLEAAELLEVFQWSGERTELPEKREKIEEETADVLIYALTLCDHLGMDPQEIIEKKLARNREKYPVEKAYGSAKKYDAL